MKKGENMKKFFCVLCGICLFYMGYAQEKEVKAVIETNLGNMIVKLYNDTPNHRDNFVRLAKAGHYDGSLFYRVIKNFVIQGGSSDSKKAIKGAAIGYGKPIVIDAEIKPEHYHKKGALAAPRQPDRVNFFKESDISQFYIVQGRKYDPKELDIIEKQVNVPIKRAIQRKYYTPEKKAILDTLRKQKKVKEFREIAEKIKSNGLTEAVNRDRQTKLAAVNILYKIYMPEEKRNAYINEGGIHHLDKEYTVFGEVIEGFEVIDKIAALPTDGNDRPITDVRIKVRILSE